MGKFATGLLIGLLVGLAFADIIFPDGFSVAIERLGEQLPPRGPGALSFFKPNSFFRP
jgi:hypothetical protein